MDEMNNQDNEWEEKLLVINYYSKNELPVATARDNKKEQELNDHNELQQLLVSVGGEPGINNTYLKIIR